MANNKLILRTLVSPWITPVSDFTRNGVLSFDDLDNNFIYLRGELIHSIETSGNTITLKKINGNDLSFISEDTFVTGGTYNPSTFTLNFTGNDGFNPFNVDVSSLLDTYISGGTYNPSNGCVSFTSTSGYTFDVCGFVTGITNTFTTGGTYDNSTSLITFTKNDSTTYGVDLSSLPVTDDVTIGVNGSNEIELKEVVGAPTGGTRIFDGYITITSGLTLNNLGTGTSINNLGIDSNGNIVVGTSGSTGTVGGSGTVNYVSRWTPSGDTLGDSLIQDNGTSLSIGNPPNNVSILDIDTSLQGVFVTTTKVNTASNQSAYGLLGISSGNNSLGENIGVAGFANANTNRAIGVLGNAINNVGNTNIGGYFTAASGVNNYSLQLRDGTEGTGKFLKSVTANGEANWATITASDVSGVVGGSGTVNYVSRWTPDGTTLGDSVIQDDGTGKVGIGGVEPNSLLNLQTSSVYRNLLITNTRTVSGIGIQANLYGASTGGNIGIWSNVYNSSKYNIAGYFRTVATTTPSVSDFNIGIEATVGPTIGMTIGSNRAVRALLSSDGGITNPTNRAIEAIVGSVNTSNDNIGVYSEVKPFTGGNRYATQLIDGTEGVDKFLKSVTADGKANWATITASDITGPIFTGNTSGDCISDLYVSTIHSCSPLFINPSNEGDVYIGNSSFTADTTNDMIYVTKLNITNTITASTATTVSTLGVDSSGNVVVEQYGSFHQLVTTASDGVYHYINPTDTSSASAIQNSSSYLKLGSIQIFGPTGLLLKDGVDYYVLGLNGDSADTGIDRIWAIDFSVGGGDPASFTVYGTPGIGGTWQHEFSGV